MKFYPANTNVNKIMAWKIDIPRMCFTIFCEMMYSFFLYGGLFKS